MMTKENLSLSLTLEKLEVMPTFSHCSMKTLNFLQRVK